jgi:hypothetical protein
LLRMDVPPSLSPGSMAPPRTDVNTVISCVVEINMKEDP